MHRVRSQEDVSGVTGRDEFTETLRLLYPDSSLHVVRSYARQVWFFVEAHPARVTLQLCPGRGRISLPLGFSLGVTSTDLMPAFFVQSRGVEWINTEVRRDQLDDDLKRSLGASEHGIPPQGHWCGGKVASPSGRAVVLPL